MTKKNYLMSFSKNPYPDPYNSRLRTSAILKIVESPYPNKKSSDFDEIWYLTAYLKLKDSHVTKYLKKSKLKKFKTADERHIENRLWP